MHDDMPLVRRALILLLLAGNAARLAGEDAAAPSQPTPWPQQGDAGPAELERVEAQIAELGRALADAETERARLCAELGEWCLDRLGQAVPTWEPPSLPSTPSTADLGGFYAELLRTRLGFDPLGASPPAARDWRARERACAQADAAADRLRASLRRLERLRDRLRRQLGMAPQDSP
jgi:hypothetical protein